MNMLVTTPKSEIDNSIDEAEALEEFGGYYFRTYRFRPKVEVGDKIYFTENGQIRGYGIIISVLQTHGEICEVTGREWKGTWVIKYNQWHWLKTPIPYKGFQGIRYIPNQPELQKQLKESEE